MVVAKHAVCSGVEVDRSGEAYNGAPVMNVVEEPYDKKKRKQPMTAQQLAQLYAKQPRVSYDSDDEPVRCATPQHVRHARAAANEAWAVPIGKPEPLTFCDPQYSPVREEAWRQELQAALDRQYETSRAYRPSNRILFGDDFSLDEDTDDDLYDVADDPNRVVADPFYPDLTCTAAERNACLEEEQARRERRGLPLLVKNPANPNHWVEPPVAPPPIFVEASVTDDVITDRPPLQATPSADIVWSPATPPPHSS